LRFFDYDNTKEKVLEPEGERPREPNTGKTQAKLEGGRLLPPYEEAFLSLLKSLFHPALTAQRPPKFHPLLR